MGRLPVELVEFIRSGNNMLLIKGSPGSGKTILSLELLRRFSKDRTCVYLGTRVSAERMLTQHPWLRGVVDPHNLLSSEASSTGRISIADTRFEGSPIEQLFEAAMDTENPFVVIDSWDVLTESMEAVERSKALKVLEALLSSRNANLVFVSETTGTTPLDYQADGIVALSVEDLEGRLLRILELRKLRGIRIPRTRHLFSLEKGRFHHLPPFSFRGVIEGAWWKPIPDSETHFSTGCVALDRLLGGGYPKGGTVLLSFGSDIPRMAGSIFGISVLTNFLFQGRGFVAIPVENWGLGEIVELGGGLFGEQAFDLPIRILTTVKPPEQMPTAVALRGDDMDADFEVWRRTHDALREETGQPVLAITDMRKQADRYGEGSYVRAIGESVELLRRSGSLEIRIAVPGIEKVTRKAAQLADVHLRIESRFGCTYVYGVKPFTGIHRVGVRISKGVPKLDLTAIV